MAPFINLSTLFGRVDTPQTLSPVKFRGSENIGASKNISTFNYGVKEGNKDSFISNPIGVEFEDEATIKRLAEKNQRIKDIFKEIKKPIQVNTEALQSLRKGHLSATRTIAATIYSALPENIKREVSPVDIQKAAYLHDYGKVLIPKEILNKKGKLTPEEMKIMQLHSELGYELLKQQWVNKKVLNLVKYHHQKPDGSGYPTINNDYENSYEAQILTIADKYSALTENRCYRKACTKDEVVKILYPEIENEVKKGNISQEVFDAFKESVKFL